MPIKQLVRSEIQYLSFEGGGGAGNAYPGALGALAELGLIQYDPRRTGLPPTTTLDLAKADPSIDWRMQGQILGVSGASAGAINALFMALGYTPTEVEHILDINDFNEYFDEIRPGLNPHVGGFRQDYTAYNLASYYDEFSKTTAGKIFNIATLKQPLSLIQFDQWVASIQGTFLSKIMVTTLGLLDEFPETAINQLSVNATNDKDAASFVYDFGIFPGIEIRRFFARHIALAVERTIQGNPRYSLKAASGGTYGPASASESSAGRTFYDAPTNSDVRTSEITFRMHQEIFGKKLLVTGTNLETLKSHFFSADTTPNFRVVDAVRISMSLPMIFKPMVIKEDGDLKLVINAGEPLPEHYLKGVWADGGLLNNIPVAAFDELADGPEHTLGLTVGVEERTDIDNLFGFLGAYLLGFLKGTGNSQLSATTAGVDRIIELSTSDPLTGGTIGLLDFRVEETLYKNINAQSKATVEQFFADRVIAR